MISLNYVPVGGPSEGHVKFINLLPIGVACSVSTLNTRQKVFSWTECAHNVPDTNN